MLLTDLDENLLLLIGRQLDTCSLAGLACTCRRLKALVASDELWEPFCRARWSHLHAASYKRQADAGSNAVSSSAGGTDWKELYYQGNGWRDPSFELRQLPLDADCDYVSAIARSAPGELLTIATSHHIEAWELGTDVCTLWRMDYFCC